MYKNILTYLTLLSKLNLYMYILIKASYNNSMKYQITQKELVCINILIRTIQEAINRNSFDKQEVDKICKTIDLLNSRNTNNKNTKQTLT